MRDGDVRSPEPSALDLSGVTRSFGARTVLSGVTLSLARGEVVALLGASGCGKTTLLRVVAGLLEPSGGEIRIAGRTVASSLRSLPPEARGLAMVFQDYALWPHLSVARNVAFAARAPGTLSGGQQQRGALARALVARPPLILFDEPPSNLDKELRDGLAREIASLLRDEGLSALYVTHDQGEAFAVADRIAVMAGGRVLQDATPEALVARPASAEVAQFLNLGAIVAGDVAGGVFRHAASGLALRADAADGPAEALLPRRAPRADPVGPILDEIAEQRFRGDDVLVTARLPDGAVLSFAHPQRLPGGGVRLSLDPAAVTVFAAASARPALTPIPEEA